MSPPPTRRRRLRRGAVGGLQLAGGAALALLLAALASGVRDAEAAARIHHGDDALLGPDINSRKDFYDNRLRPSQDPEDKDKDELLLVHVLFRHGDRTPDAPTYTNDPYANYTYPPIGLGGLTPAGRRREYRIGKFLRHRYGDFLGSYRPEVVSPRTTDWPRTKDSMSLVLAGLFPPSRQDVWSDAAPGEADLGHLWMPISAESTPRNEDKLLYMWDVACPALDRLRNEVLKTAAFQKQFRGSNTALISYLEKYSGDKINIPDDVYQIYQALLAQQGFNLSLPAWTTEVFPDKMKPLVGLYFELDNYTKKMQRFRAGPLLKRIIRHSVAKMLGLLQPADRKMYLYAAHDNNVAALLMALQVWEKGTVPPYGATVIAEVRRKCGFTGVQLYLRNSTGTDDLHPLTIPDCEHFCPMHKFVRLTQDVVPDDWDAECNEPEPPAATATAAAE